jgi:Family of unknown function (DUF5372)
MVIMQEPTQSLTALHIPGAAEACIAGEQQDVVLPLMIALSMVMLDVFAQGAPQGALAEGDHLGQALLLHRPYPALRIGIVKSSQLHSYRLIGRKPSWLRLSFTPLYGRELRLMDQYLAWGEDRVCFRDDGGELRYLPTAWTSIAPPDPFVRTSAGRSHFRIEDLLRLAALIAQQAPAQRPKPRQRRR